MRLHIALVGLKSLAKVRACDNRIGMRESWPHAPPHYFTLHGTYIITAATLHRAPLFGSDAKLDLPESSASLSFVIGLRG